MQRFATLVKALDKNMQRRYESMEILKNRVDMVGYITVKNSNLNGDIDMENMPRMDAEGYGFATDVCLKRSIRDNVALLYPDRPGYGIYILNDNTALETKVNKCISELDEVNKKDLKGAKGGNKIKEVLCQQYFDIRAFGAVITGLSKIPGADGQLLGPVAVTFAESLEPIDPQQLTISRVSIQTEKDLERKSQELGKKWVVPYAVYRFEVHVSAAVSENTGFTEEDLEVLIEAIRSMYENMHTSAKTDISLSNLYVFRHKSKLGNCPMRKLSSAIHVEKITPEIGREYYHVTLDEGKVPEGVSVEKYED